MKDGAFWIEYGFTSPGDAEARGELRRSIHVHRPRRRADQDHFSKRHRGAVLEMPRRGRIAGPGYRRNQNRNELPSRTSSPGGDHDAFIAQAWSWRSSPPGWPWPS
ncbi:MAG: hypothetical protein M0C28_35445 [Candidatus Moduliflexus flocculans]|nr:hypothetical protein [Candidatus Moduliflexus flocculans]